MTTHLPHWSKLSFHKKPAKLVTPADTSPPPMVQTAGRRPPSTIFTDDASPRGTAAATEEGEEDKGRVGGTEEENSDEEGSQSKKEEIESKQELKLQQPNKFLWPKIKTFLFVTFLWTVPEINDIS
jgi:hypothetical protein